MTGVGTSRFAKYGKLGAGITVVVAVVVGAANIDGFLSLMERVFGTSNSQNSTVEAGPAADVTSTTREPAVTSTTITSEPVPPEEIATSEVEATTPRQTTQLPEAAPPTRAGALVLTIRMGSTGKIGPSEYRAGAAPGANVDVYDDVGQLSQGCYPSWILTRDGIEVKKARNGRCTSGGITMFNFGDSLEVPGSYRLSVNVVTDGGQTGATSVDFTVS